MKKKQDSDRKSESERERKGNACLVRAKVISHLIKAELMDVEMENENRRGNCDNDEDVDDDATFVCYVDVLQVHCCKLNIEDVNCLQHLRDQKHQHRLHSVQSTLSTFDGCLLGLIAFARKFGRAILSLIILFCIIFFSFQFGNANTNSLLDESTTTSAPLIIPPPGPFANN